MLKNIDNAKLPITIGGKKWYLRYNLNAQLCIEYSLNMSFDDIINKKDWSLEETLEFLRALLIDNFYQQNKKFINQRKFYLCKPTLAEIGGMLSEEDLTEISLKILQAVSMALPDTVETSGNFRKAVQKMK